MLYEIPSIDLCFKSIGRLFKPIRGRLENKPFIDKKLFVNRIWDRDNELVFCAGEELAFLNPEFDDGSSDLIIDPRFLFIYSSRNGAELLDTYYHGALYKFLDGTYILLIRTETHLYEGVGKTDDKRFYLTKLFDVPSIDSMEIIKKLKHYYQKKELKYVKLLNFFLFFSTINSKISKKIFIKIDFILNKIKNFNLIKKIK